MVGHTNCGGAAACLEAIRPTPSESLNAPDSKDPLSTWLAPLTDLARDVASSTDKENQLQKLIEENVRAQVLNISRSTSIRRVWAERNVQIHGWIYDLSTGRLRDLGCSVDRTTRGDSE